MQALLPANETDRLEALRQYGVLDTSPEPELDDLTHLAAQICVTPISAITLVDEDRQWFKSLVGMEIVETPRNVSFCSHAILEDDLLLVPDVCADERFADNPFVTSEPHIRFYAGVPLVIPGGHKIGTLCVLDTVPRQLDQNQQDALRRLGRQVVALLEARPDATTQQGQSKQSRQARHRSERQGRTLAAAMTRQDQENLKVSEIRYRRLFETAKDGILILDAETGEIEDVNPYLCRLLGYEPDEFLGRQLWEIGTFRDIAANQDAFRTLQQQEYIRYDDLPLETKEGHHISVEFVSNVYMCAEKEVIQCNIRDISGRRRAEDALRESEIRYRALAEAAPDDIFIFNRAGIMQYVNLHAARNFGLLPDALVGKSFEELFPLRIAKANQQSFNRVFQSGEPLYEEARLRFQNRDLWRGAWLVPLKNAAGEVSEVMGVARDISGQKQAEATLRASEARYRSLFDSNPQPMWVYDCETLGFLAVNDAAIAHYGYTEDEFLAMTIKEIRPQEGIPALIAFIADPSLPDGKSGIWRHRKKNGAIIDVEVRTHELSFRERPARLILAHDITARRETERALQQAHEELELRVVERTAELGKVNESLRVENAQHQETMRSLRQVAKALQQAKEAADTANTELLTEITERWRAVEAQQESYALLQAVSEGTTDCIFVKDLQGRYLMINSAGALRRKKTVAEILDRVDADLFSPETADIFIEADHRILAAGSTQTFEETTVEDGEIRTHLVTKGPHRNPRGEVIGIVGIARDITARKQQEESLRIAKETADVANAAKSEFLSRMSHELRTPLNAILGFGQILDKQDLAPLSKESVSYILKGGQHLLDLINEVLDIACVEAGRLELSLQPIAFEEVVLEVCALMRPLAAARAIHLDGSASNLSLNYILADRQRLKQVLINLVSNAIKYNREGGNVAVSYDQKSDGWTAIAVRDTGLGITPQDLPKLFTPFERLSAPTSGIEGSGLGLVLSQHLVTAMGGTLKVESTLGQGTTFTIEFPQAASPGEPLADLSQGIHPAAPGMEAQPSFSVLCIDDNPSQLRLLELILHDRAEITLLTAMQGRIGLELARQHEPDLILLDLNLPDINGREVLARLQQSAITRKIPVVVISADATPNQVERLLAAGAKACLTKPLDVDQFLLTLDEALQVMSVTAIQLNTGEASA